MGLHGDIAVEEIQQERAAAAEQSRLAARRPGVGTDAYARLHGPEATIRGKLALAGSRGVPRRKVGTRVRKQRRQDRRRMRQYLAKERIAVSAKAVRSRGTDRDLGTDRASHR